MFMKMLKKLVLLFIVFIVAAASACTATSINNNNVNQSMTKGVSDMNVKLKYMGQGTVRIITEENKVIYVDPFAGDDYSMAADLILQTHDHFDHSALNKVANRNKDCQIITEKEALANGKHNTFDLPFVKVISVEAGYN